jgi:hypothetical protein
MSTIRKALFAAIGCLVCVSPVSAQPNNQTPGVPPNNETAGVPALAPDKTFGMALLSALVRFDGRLLFGSGVATTRREAVGNYRVRFDRPINTCVYVGAPATDTTQTNRIVVLGLQQDKNSPFGLIVETFNLSGAPFDAGFSVIVYCNK